MGQASVRPSVRVLASEEEQLVIRVGKHAVPSPRYSVSEKPTVAKMVKEYFTISLIRRVITVFTTAQHRYPSLARLTQSTPRAVFKTKKVKLPLYKTLPNF